MLRNAALGLVVAGLVGAGVVVCRAQTQRLQLDQPEFEISVTLETYRGVTRPRLTCVRGCQITWPAVTPEGGGTPEILYPTNAMPCPIAPSGEAMPCRIVGWTQP